MASQQIDSNRSCSSCNTEVSETDTMQCYECKLTFHAFCTEVVTPYCTNHSFLSSFKKVKSGNFLFLCDLCLTKKEHNMASTINDQISTLSETVNLLVKEFSAFKDQSAVKVVSNDNDKKQPWSNPKRVAKMKASLCIKSNGTPVD